MSYRTLIGPFYLIFVVLMTDFGFSENMNQIETKLSLFPETTAFGDTCYVLVSAVNHSNKVARVPMPQFQFINDYIVQFELSRHEKKIWRGTFECWVYIEALRERSDWFSISSDEAVTFLAVPLQFPPLEDLYQDVFWKEIREELKSKPEGIPLDFEIVFAAPSVTIQGEDHFANGRPTQKVTVKLRNEKEMAMIDKWYHNTPCIFFPVLAEGRYLSNVPPQGLRNESGKKILDNSPWVFINTGNRYPSDPNVPETWQGWKELEESLSPSTMRDEIRLTRMLIQYCDTEDNAVLKEFKEWFVGMNEIQRTVMAKSLRDRAVECYGKEKLLPSFREIYKTIRAYDIVPVPENNVKHLRNLKLIE